METTWQLHDAKNRFSELVGRARTEGPQTVTRRGKAAVVVLSIEDYERLREPRTDLVDYLLGAPLEGLGLDRDADDERPVELG